MESGWELRCLGPRLGLGTPHCSVMAFHLLFKWRHRVWLFSRAWLKCQLLREIFLNSPSEHLPCFLLLCSPYFSGIIVYTHPSVLFVTGSAVRRKFRRVFISFDNRYIPDPLVKAMVFPVVMYRCKSWTIKSAESQRIDAFSLRC